MPVHEIFSAFAASFVISPIMSLIDLSIIKSQLNKESFNKSIVKNIQYYSSNPSQFYRPLFVMFNVYGLTYSTANLTELYCFQMNLDYKVHVLVNTSIVNILAINFKDMFYSKLLLSNTNVSYPLLSKVLFGMRDTITIGANFVVKKDFIAFLENHVSYSKADIIASLTIPSLAQILSTPIHIAAIDLYQNRNQSLMERLQNMRNTYGNVLIGRVFRTIPAFCVGGFINDMLRPDRKQELF